MGNGHVSPPFRNGPKDFQLQRLVTPGDEELLCPIRYIYDYLPGQRKWLKAQPISLSRIFAETYGWNQAERTNSILLHTQAAHLPLHTGLENFRQNKYWEVNETATRELLELFAKDHHCSKFILSNKWSMSDLAKDQLKTAVIDTYSRFSIYMFAEADKNRIQLLAQTVILIFVFDDVWENASIETVEHLREYFVSRLLGSLPSSAADTPLERRLTTIRQGLLAGDEEEGNGGAEVLQTLIDFCNHAEPPRGNFSSVRDYLDYRWEDVANSYTWACVKFSTRSSVNQGHPNLHRVLRYLGDHISIANDIASYEKEKRRFETGGATSMINLVQVIMKVDRMDAMAAKSIAYAWQLYMEDEIVKELRELKRRNELSVEDWRFLDACLLAASGNLLTSVVMSRYGGEDARIA